MYVIFYGSFKAVLNYKMTEYDANFCKVKGETSSRLQST